MSRPHPTRRGHAAGFTLVELLTVIVIIAILAALTLNISKLVLRRQTEAKARSEMLTITTDLETFKVENPEYPPMDSDEGSGSPYAERNLIKALTGHARWTTNKASGQPIWETVPMGRRWADGGTVSGGNGEKYLWGHEYIELAKFTYDKDDATESHVSNNAVLYDPWWSGEEGKNAYLYRYKTISDVTNPNPNARNWQSRQYILISRGSDGLPEAADDNFLWKPVNGHTLNSGFMIDGYGDPSAHPGLADNLVMGSFNWPP